MAWFGTLVAGLMMLGRKGLTSTEQGPPGNYPAFPEEVREVVPGPQCVSSGFRLTIFTFFGDILQIFCYHHDGTPKRQSFCVDRMAGWSPGGRQGPFLAKKLPENEIFLRYTLITHLFGSQTDPTQWDHNIPIS